LANELEYNAIKHAILKVSEYHVLQEVQPVISYAIAERGYSDAEYQAQLSNADIFIATVDIKTASLVDLGGMDDLTPSYGSAASKKQKLTYAKFLKQQLSLAKKLQIPTILIAKGSPYLINEYSDLSDSVLLNFDDRVYLDSQQQAISPGYNASLKVIFNRSQALGILPVTLKD
jgi:beta-N-acetylhexosaminidase